jgi:hypothetical protein
MSSSKAFLSPNPPARVISNLSEIEPLAGTPLTVPGWSSPCNSSDSTPQALKTPLVVSPPITTSTSGIVVSVTVRTTCPRLRTMSPASQPSGLPLAHVPFSRYAIHRSRANTLNYLVDRNFCLSKVDLIAQTFDLLIDNSPLGS